MARKNATQDATCNRKPKQEPDGRVPGLSLRHGAKGSAWFLYYRTKSGRQRRPKLASAAVMTRSEARKLAREMLVAVARGEDPASAASRNGKTVNDLLDRFEAEHRPHVKASTWRHYKQLIDDHIRPRIGKLYLADVTRDDIAKLHQKMIDTPYQANRMLAVMHQAYRMAQQDWGWVDQNPVHVRRYKEHQRRRYPHAEEAARILAALDTHRPEQPYFVALIELLALTGCRLREIMLARWEWVHDDGLHLPDSKGGEKIVPLNSHARQVLQEIPRQRDNPWIICGRIKGQPMNHPHGMWTRLLADAQVSDLRMHDLRRYFASVALSHNLALETVGQLLGHKQAQTTKRYAYLMTNAATAASELVGSAMRTNKKPAYKRKRA